MLFCLLDVVSRDPNAYSMSKVNRSVQMDIALSLQNLQLLIQRIKHFYLTSVQQLVISNLPNISSICYDPEGGTVNVLYFFVPLLSLFKKIP